MEGTAYTYIVECGDGSLYTGWTNHLEERIVNHNNGKGAKYTRARLPVHLVYYCNETGGNAAGMGNQTTDTQRQAIAD